MSRNRVSLWFMAVSAAVTMLIMGSGMAFAAHPNIPLYTFEEVAQQFDATYGTGDGTTVPMMPVALDGEMKGFPYSPKQTCGNCHNGALVANDGTDLAQAFGLSEALVSYAEMDNGTFHVQQDANAMVETVGQSSQAGKPWTQSVGMAGKW